MSNEPWIFENLSNWGKGGSKTFERSSRTIAEDMAHEQLRGWYSTVQYWNGKRYFSVAESLHEGRDRMETHYFNSRNQLVGKVRRQTKL